MVDKDMAELVERLRTTRRVRFTASARDDDDAGPTELPFNPDGPEAADAITLLLAEKAKMREALESCRRYITQYGTSQSVRALAVEVDAALTEEQHD